jgi:hypothetical protein
MVGGRDESQDQVPEPVTFSLLLPPPSRDNDGVPAAQAEGGQVGRKLLLAVLMIVSVCGASALSATASTPKTTITSVSPTSVTVGTEVTITGTNLAGATEVTFDRTIATVISDTATTIVAYVPAGATTGYIKVKTPGGTARSSSEFTVLPPLDDVMSVVSGAEAGYCALLTSGGVDCWGYNSSGDLGDGTYFESDTPVAVEGVGGTGTLTEVMNLVGDSHRSYCALLISRRVDCWGSGQAGELGNGSKSDSDIPVGVEGVGGTGTLTRVTNLVGNYYESYCALLTSGGVDCWGRAHYGMLGDGSKSQSDTPVVVKGVGGTGRLTEVTNLVGSGGGFNESYCAVLASGQADCWGEGVAGELGNGSFYTSDIEGNTAPVEVG